jgi:hypothetical protein
VCTKNENGKYPSCVEAKYGGSGCEDIELCEECKANEIHLKIPLRKKCGCEFFFRRCSCRAPGEIRPNGLFGDGAVDQ